MRRGAALVLLLSACGRKEPEPSGGGGEASEYREWRGRQLPLPLAGFAATVKGKIAVLPPESRAARADDYGCELKRTKAE